MEDFQFMSAAEIMKKIPAQVFAKMKAADSSPLVKVFPVGHEGKSYPQEINRFGEKVSKVLNWLKSGVKGIFNNLKIGNLLFDGHNEDNSLENRTVVGELVGKVLQKINGKLHTIGITWIYPEYKNRDFDVASIETTLNVPPTREMTEANVGEITGIALAESAKKAKPAFPGATLLTAMQFLQEQESDDKDVKNAKEKIEEKKEENNVEITFEKIKEFLEKFKVSVTQLFSVEEILQDKSVLNSLAENYINKKEFDKLKGELETENADLKSQINRTNVEKEITIALDDEKRSLGGKAKEFIRDHLKDFNLQDDGTPLEKQIQKFVNEKVEAYGKYFDSEEEETDDTDDTGKGSGKGKKSEADKGVGPAKKGAGAVDYTKPEENDLIAD